MYVCMYVFTLNVQFHLMCLNLDNCFNLNFKLKKAGNFYPKKNLKKLFKNSLKIILELNFVKICKG